MPGPGKPFKKGEGGRPKGRPNAITASLKEMIEGALSDAGGRSYLLAQSEKNPTAFMALVGKLLPKDVNATVNAQMDVRAWLMSLGEPEK